MNCKFNSDNKLKRILVTGGAGFIGSSLIRRLIIETNTEVFNIDKLTYASDLTFLEELNKYNTERHHLIKVDLSDSISLQKAVINSNPDIIFHLAAESHVDRSIDSPREFIDTNIVGTFNLLQSALKHYRNLTEERKRSFKFVHVSTDEVFGSLGKDKYFDEKTPYNPKSPYSSTKAASDHLAKSWANTYELPVVVTNCSNNYGPRQFPEKLIPLTITNALKNKTIPIFGKGENIRDWLYVEDHINALLLVAQKGLNGNSYCIGGGQEISNLKLAEYICEILDKVKPTSLSYKDLISFVDDRPGHDFRYSINPSKIIKELGWSIEYPFQTSLETTVKWYLNNQDWCEKIMIKSGYKTERLGLKKYV